MTAWRDLAIGIVLAAGIVPPQSAEATTTQQPRSIVTAVDLKACEIVARHKDGNAWLCRGLRGYPLHIAEGDARFFVSAGPDAERRQAAGQTLAPFNSLAFGKGDRTLVEWRVRGNVAAPLPHAFIVRYETMSDGRKGQVLAVIKIDAKQTCHAAYIDALATPNALALARSAADTLAPDFDCKRKPEIVGRQGRSPM